MSPTTIIRFIKARWPAATAVVLFLTTPAAFAAAVDAPPAARPDSALALRGDQAVSSLGDMTVEGENDDISGIGQTQAAHDLCVNLPASMKADYIQPGVGHYGVFNGARWRSEIQPRVRDFILSNEASGAA